MIAKLALYGWFLSFFLFNAKNPRKSILIIFLGAWLFLPETKIIIPTLPDLSKDTVSGFVVLAAIFVFDFKAFSRISFTKFDIPIVVFCISPIFTSLSNDLGLWDGFSSSINTTLTWGAPYLAARLYFNDIEAVKYILLATAVAALLYLPLVWIEILMSPRLHGILYGFDQGSWAQHMRYGGWRPKVFMQHGLMVAFFMAISTMVYFAIADTNLKRRIFNLPAKWLAWITLVTVIFCKSGNGLIILLFGFVCRILAKRNLARIFLLALILSIPTYITARTVGGWDGQNLLDLVEKVFDSQRAGSIKARMIQEQLFSERAAQRWVFGWGGWFRAFPVDEFGNRLTRGVDSLWIITYSENGLVALLSVFMIILTGPFLAVSRLHKFGKLDKREIYLVYIASAVPVLFAVDSLMNAMYSPLYVIISGSLVSLYLRHKKESRSITQSYTTVPYTRTE